MNLSNERFNELVEAYCDRSLGEEESRELLEAFQRDETIKGRFIDELKIANSLRGLALLDHNQAMAEDVFESIRLGEDASDMSDAVLEELRAAEKKVIAFPVARIALGLAAAFAVALLIISALAPRENSALATVAHLSDAEWGEEKRFSEGARIGRGQISLASGVARLDFAKGVRVTLEGPVEFELIGPGETRLHSGSLTAHVPPEGIGFQVHTERAEIVDLGTTFGVSVGKNGATDVTVFEGEVEVTSAKSRKEQVVTEGNAVLLDESSDDLKPVRIRSIGFRSDWPILFGVKNTGGRIRFVNRQPVQNPNQVIDRENIVVFPEKFRVAPVDGIEATFTAVGRHTAPAIQSQSKVISFKEGEAVNSYLLQYNPPYVEGIPNSEQVEFSGHVTFDRPILAVITNTEQLIATDLLLGKRRFKYPSNPLRGLEHGDSLELSEDRHTLEVNWRVMQALKRGLDQIRVVVSAADPVSTQQGQGDE